MPTEDGAAAAATKPRVRTALLSLRSGQLEYLELVALAVAVGVLAACGNLGFRALIELCGWFFRTLEWRLLGIGRGGLFRLLIPMVLLSGAGTILILNYFFPGDVLGYGFPNFLEMVNLGNARIRRRWIFVKAAGAALSLGAGASVGREGPIAQIGGAIGSAVAQLRALSASRTKVMVAAGAGAGIATTFNAPMAGLMFAQEIVLMGHAELANLTLLLIATFSAVLTSRVVAGGGAVFRPLPFVVNSYWEMTTYGAMGVALGLLAANYIWFFHATGAFFRKLALPDWTKLVAGLAVVGLIAIVLPENLGDGYPKIEQAILGGLEFQLMAALMIAKFVASAISLDCGAPGGIFGPTFFIGTMAGGTFRGLCQRLVPGLTGPRGSYALVGLGAFLGGVTHAPLTALFLLFEMTRGDWTVALPAMIATITAVAVAYGLESESIDTYRLAREGKTLALSQERLVLTQLTVASVMSRDVKVVAPNAPLAEVLRAAGATPQATLPVVDGDRRLAGLIVTHDLLALLASGAEVGPLINAYDLGRRNPPVVTPESNLDQAAQMMEYEALDELPVTEGPQGGRFLGLVARRNLAQTFDRVSVSLAGLGTRDHGIFWAAGYRVSHIRVGPAGAGRTLRELDPRARFNVTVLALQDAVDPESGFVPAAPDRALKSGDVVIAAGRASDLRRFIRELENA